MRIVLLTELFGKNMGYLENVLPKYLARLGLDVHVVATDLPLNYRKKLATRPFNVLESQLRPGHLEVLDGYTLHIVGHRQVLGYMRMQGLQQKLSSIRPTIVQTMTPIGWVGVDAAVLKPILGYRLFTGCHHHASVFPLATKRMGILAGERLHCVLTRTLPGRVVGRLTERCYAISQDCADIARIFFGVPPAKIEVCPLGVDSEIFYPPADARDWAHRKQLRQNLGVNDCDILCIYTGRLDADKNPDILARAVEQLSRLGRNFRALFIGEGDQKDSISSRRSCMTHPFVPFSELARFYRAADIGVWPAQESMSMLDAAACGIPIVVNDTMSVAERIDGNGLRFRFNDVDDLLRALIALEDSTVRRQMGVYGAKKIARQFSWDSIARRRLRDYQTAILRCTSKNILGTE